MWLQVKLQQTLHFAPVSLMNTAEKTIDLLLNIAASTIWRHDL